MHNAYDNLLGQPYLACGMEVSALRLEKPVFGRSEDSARLQIVVLHAVVFVFHNFV